MPDPRISEFWEWFEVACRSFGERLENTKAIEELDQRVGQLGSFAWEIGPGLRNSENHLLVISPGGDKELLPLTRTIIAQAPHCKGWEFYPALPPKQWDLQLDLEDSEGAVVRIDAAAWRYALLKYPDGMYEIVFAAPEMAAYEEDLRYTAAELVLDGELGEEARLDLIAVIEVTSLLEGDLLQRSNPISALRKQWADLTGV